MLKLPLRVVLGIKAAANEAATKAAAREEAAEQSTAEQTGVSFVTDGAMPMLPIDVVATPPPPKEKAIFYSTQPPEFHCRAAVEQAPKAHTRPVPTARPL